MFSAVAVFWLLLDFVTKQTVTYMMTLRESFPVWDGVFHITYVRNYGAAFSIMQGELWFFYLAMAAMLVMVTWFWVREEPEHWMPVVATALVIAGAFGNTIDRIVAGAVIDMFDFRLINFAIFNIADIGITVGGVLFALWFVFVSGHIEAVESAKVRMAERKVARAEARLAKAQAVVQGQAEEDSQAQTLGSSQGEKMGTVESVDGSLTLDAETAHPKQPQELQESQQEQQTQARSPKTEFDMPKPSLREKLAARLSKIESDLDE